MHGNKRFALSAGLAVLALSVSAGARAETLIYVTSDAIGTVDSSAPGTDNTAGNNGPLSYSLPGGYYTIGAKVSDDAQALYLLAYNGSNCALFAVNANGGSNGAANLNQVQSYSCSISSGGGDFGFIDGSGGLVLDEYLVANGPDLYVVTAGGASVNSAAVENTSGSAANLTGVAGIGSSGEQLAIDTSVEDLVELNLGTSPVTETGVAALGLSPGGSTSLDYSTASGIYYLYTNGQLYGATSASGGFTGLGDAPGGTLSMSAAENVAVDNNGNGGAFGPAVLLPLLGLFGLRRRKRQA
jgi:hypothetical protein